MVWIDVGIIRHTVVFDGMPYYYRGYVLNIFELVMHREAYSSQTLPSALAHDYLACDVTSLDHVDAGGYFQS